MSRIFDGISAFLKERFDADNWETDDDGDRTVAFRLEDDEGREWDGAVLIDDDAEMAVFYSTLLDKAAPKRRPAVMEVLTRANYSLPVGNFEIDLDDGEVCFKTYLELEGVELTSQMCEHLVLSNFTMMGTYFDGIKKVMEGSASPVDAIASVEAVMLEGIDEDDDDDDDE